MLWEPRIGHDEGDDEADEKDGRVEWRASLVTDEGAERLGLLSLHHFFSHRDLFE